LSNATTCGHMCCCHTQMRVGRPWGAVTLSRWCEWWYRRVECTGGSLNLNSTNLPRPWSQRESSPSRKIPTVEPGNRTRDLMISSQRPRGWSHRAMSFTRNM
jgi:hypothetical protein